MARASSASRIFRGRLHSEAGLDVPALHAFVAEHGSLEGYETGVERITNDVLLELPCDILVLAAREDQVTGRERREPALPARRGRRERPDVDRG